jgi:hypothetical protein
MARTFQATRRYEYLSTRNYPGVECPYFMVSVQVRNNSTGVFDREPEPFLWDTGASLSMVSRKFAIDHGLRLHDTEDRLPGGLGGVGGSQPAWLTTMKVRFPLLSRRRREPDLMFPFHVIVLDKLDMPILGTRDVLLNFAVESTWDGTSFTLNRDHRGEAA